MDPIGHGYVRRIGETAIAWWELGVGDPLILIHGVGDSHRTWRRVAPILAKRYRLIMPDLPGHGLSGRPDAPYTIPWFSSTMHAWLDTLGISRAPMVGHSYGGGVAQWMLLDRNERVERLALIASGGLGRDVGMGLRLTTMPVLGAALTPSFMSLGTMLMMRYGMGGRAVMEREEIDRLVWMNRMPGTGMAFHRTLAACISPFGQGEVPTLPPIAFFWGESDAVIPVRHAHEAMARLDGASLVTYPGAGHCPHLDDADRFTRDLLEFLDAPARTPVQLPTSEEDAARGLRESARASIESVVQRVGDRIRRASAGVGALAGRRDEAA